MNKALEVLLDNVSNGLFLIEVNNLVYAEEAISQIKQKMNILHIDFDKQDAEFYDQNIHRNFDAVIFSGFNLLEDPVAFLSNCNLNRDNFIKRKLPFYFIVSTRIKNIINKRFPNLNSYFIVTINLDKKLSVPFKQIMSMDRIVFKNNLVSFHYINDLRYSDIFKLNKDILNQIKHGYGQAVLHEGEKPDNIRLLQDFFEDCITLNQSWLYGQRYEDVIMVTLELLRVLIGKTSTGTSKLSINEVLSSLSDLKDDLLKYQVITRYQLTVLMRQLATATFYIKSYEMAAYMFLTILNWSEDLTPEVATTEEIDSITQVQMDLAICSKKRGIHNHYLMCMQEVVTKDHILQTNPEVLFIYQYNELLYLLASDSIISISSELQYLTDYRRMYSNDSAIVLRFSILIAWMLGCYNGQLVEAIDLMEQTEKGIRDVFPENHYVIAEAAYCYGVLDWLLGDVETAQLKVKKAINILNNDAEHNTSLIKLMKQFFKENLS